MYVYIKENKIEFLDRKMLSNIDEYIMKKNNNELKKKDAFKYLLPRSLTFNYVPETFKLPTSLLAFIGFYYHQKDKLIKCSSCKFTYSDLEIDSLTKLIVIHLNSSENCELSKHHYEVYGEIIDSRKNDEEKDTLRKKKEVFQIKEKRIETFLRVPGLKYTIDDFVDNGLFRVEDQRLEKQLYKLHCAFCDYSCILVKNSFYNTNYEKPMEEHYEKFGTVCPIIKKDEPMDVVDIEQQQQEQSSPKKIEYQGSKNFEELKNILAKTVNATCNRPFHPGYTTEHSRFESFKAWPIELSQKPDDLAKAGFYYFGKRDMVKCFYCNGGLRNWDPNDQPMEEHARWFPRCPYIRQLKGMDYIDAIKEKYKDADSGFTEDYDDTPQYYDLGTNDMSGSQNGRPVSPRLITARMDLPVVRRLIDELGIKRNLIKTAIEKKLREDGNDYENTIELIKAVTKLEKKNEKMRNQLKKSFHLYIYNLPNDVSDQRITDLFQIKFEISKISINRSDGLIMIQLEQENYRKCEEIVNELNGKPFPGSFSQNKILIQTTLEKEDLSKQRTIEDIKITYKPPVEKLETKNLPPIDREKLLEEMEALKRERNCVICLDKQRNITFLPCAHLAACVECSVSMSTCPVCRTPIQATVRTYS